MTDEWGSITPLVRIVASLLTNIQASVWLSSEVVIPLHVGLVDGLGPHAPRSGVLAGTRPPVTAPLATPSLHRAARRGAITYPDAIAPTPTPSSPRRNVLDGDLVTP